MDIKVGRRKCKCGIFFIYFGSLESDTVIPTTIVRDDSYTRTDDDDDDKNYDVGEEIETVITLASSQASSSSYVLKPHKNSAFWRNESRLPNYISH